MDFKARVDLWFETLEELSDEQGAKTGFSLMYDAAKEGIAFEDAWKIIQEVIVQGNV